MNYLRPRLYIGILILAVFVLSTLFLHFRGKVRHKFSRQLTSHNNLFAPYSAFAYLCSEIRNTPFIKKEQFNSATVLDENWETIREEAKALFDASHITQSNKVDDLAFNSFFRTGWGRFYLKWYDDFLPSGKEHCPNTVKLLKGLPDVNAAMFASLPPGAVLKPHRDPFAGSLRYHLGLLTPNSESCFIKVDGITHHWKDGESVMFDETYIHSAENNTNEQRIILFCDINRPMRFKWANAVNRFIASKVIKASATKNYEGEKVGFLNIIFAQLHKLHGIGRSIKKWNRKIYYSVKYLLFGSLIYLIFF